MIINSKLHMTYMAFRCIASCTSYIEEITSSAERLQGIDAGYHQFRFSVGSPQAEAKFRAAVETAMKADSNAKKYPTIYVCSFDFRSERCGLISYQRLGMALCLETGIQLFVTGSISMWWQMDVRLGMVYTLPRMGRPAW
jgi:hypothetical protein